jgi:hypothetical protein
VKKCVRRATQREQKSQQNKTGNTAALRHAHEEHAVLATSGRGYMYFNHEQTLTHNAGVYLDRAATVPCRPWRLVSQLGCHFRD